MQGRALGFLVLLGASWVAVRIAIATVAPSAPAPIVDAATTTHPKITDFARSLAFIPEHEHRISTKGRVEHLARSQAARATVFRANAAAPMFRRYKSNTASPATPFRSQLPFSTPDHNVRTPPTPSALPFATQRDSATKNRPFDIYAYSFWRRGNPQTAILGYGQYGGSQSAIIADVPLLRFGADKDTPRLAITGRVSVAHGLRRERELAAGLKWRPSLDIPVSVIAERRFRQDQLDALAIFLAGGRSDVALPLKFRLDGFGQAGVVSGKSGGVFVDAMLQARRRVGKIGLAGLSVGAGAWAGGQDKVLRVDIGPSIAAEVPIAGAPFRLEASWRLCVAGNAAPRNGPAITLSTSF